MKRRQLLKSALYMGLASTAAGRTLAAQTPLARTPRDYEGPYYPVGDRHRTNDLVVGEPRDQVLYFRGRVVDIHGKPIVGGLVDIWQADSKGRYKHPRDKTAGERWDEFLYWAETPTDANGEFEFRTYLPGAYARRPAHIHYKVWRKRQHLLTSQVYFKQTGGTRGASRNASKADLQTVALISAGEDLSCSLQIVV